MYTKDHTVKKKMRPFLFYQLIMSEIFSLRVVETATIPVSFSTMISKVYLFFYSWGVVLITNAIIRIIIVVQKTFTSNRTNNVSAEARPDDRETNISLHSCRF